MNATHIGGDGEHEERRSKWEAAAWVVGLSIWFAGIYNFCNWFTGQRQDVGTAYFEWELAIPLVPVMIIPYWSLDLFFILAPFVCQTQGELRRLGKRLTLAIFAAGVCFLLFPLKLGFTRNVMDGPLQFLFTALYSFDQPYNLAPSLHVAIRSILWTVFIPKTSGWSQRLLQVWFILIGASTLLTHQHHVLDVLAGQLLSAACIYAFPVSGLKTREGEAARNPRLAIRYGLLSLCFMSSAIILGAWGMLLLWPGVSFAILSIAYCGRGSIVFRKHQGSIPLSTYMLLAPYYVGAYLTWWPYWKRPGHAHEIRPGLWMGRYLRANEALSTFDDKPPAVLDLTGELSEPEYFRSRQYLNLPILDFTAPSLSQMKRAVAFIEKHRHAEGVYVHCALGYSRSACMVGAYLMASGEVEGALEAIEEMKKIRNPIIIHDQARERLKQFELLLKSQSPVGAGGQVA
jgi:protein-tyrosine phosphatase/membrane-associated phospholipid phosphatase